MKITTFFIIVLFGLAVSQVVDDPTGKGTTASEKFVSGVHHSKEGLLELKDAAYQKMVDAANALESAREGIWDTTYNAWQATRDSYQKAKNQVSEYMKISGDTIQANYYQTKDAFSNAVKSTEDYLKNAKDRSTEEYYRQLENLDLLEAKAKQKYDDAAEALHNYYNDAYCETRKDYDSAAQNLAQAQQRVRDYQKDKSRQASEKYHQTLKQLEESVKVAEEQYQKSKANFDDISGRVNDYYNKGLEDAQYYWDLTKARATMATDALKQYGEDSKNEASETYELMKRRANDFSQKAGELRDRVGNTYETMKQKVQDWSARATQKVQENLGMNSNRC
jgi:ElaB/YqjD/DUF883 family membrane-anchored ribosome-binding protein